MKNLAILQARTGSSRLPGKVLKQINGKPMIEWQILRILESEVDSVVLATSDDESDDELAKVVQELGVDVFRGALNDVHSRFVAILTMTKPDYFMRLTGDCPVVMPDLVNSMMAEFEFQELEYLSNLNPPTFPDGLDVEIISTQAFLDYSNTALTDQDLEHVTIGMRQRPGQIRIRNFENAQDFSKMRWTVDYEEDLAFIREVFKFFSTNELGFKMEDILRAIESGQIRENLIPASFRNISLNKGMQND